MRARNLKSNNYLNVTNEGGPWMDAGGKPSRTGARGRAVFADPVHGVRAGLLLLRTRYLDDQQRTIRDLVSRWTPPAPSRSRGPAPGTDPAEYVAFVSARMGIPADQPLQLFEADGSVGNVGRLRDLFCAMATYEVGGGFRVPRAQLDAGLELIEPGIRRRGARGMAGSTPLRPASPAVAGPRGRRRAVASRSAEPAAAQPARSGWVIRGSVGPAGKGANAAADVTMVQSMLRSASMILAEPRIDPGGIDGVIAKTGASRTVQAIEGFQSRFLVRPDGMIDVGGRTWRELVAVLDRGAAPAPAPPPAAVPGGECFPFAKLPTADWTSGARKFGSNRAGNRAHGGTDLYAPAGTTIHAVADGTVTRGQYPFYCQTFALEVDHGTFLARYGEIQRALVRQGERVAAGQPIALVGHLVGITVPSDMLHLELYAKRAHGPLTTSRSDSAIAPGGRPFMRRKDLVSPEPFLERWRTKLPGAQSLTRDVAFAGAPSADIPRRGFCVHVRRLRQEARAGIDSPRTVGEYRCYWNGEPIRDLDGQMVERGGPGDNTARGARRHLRIAPGRYPLAVHAGTNYATYRYAAGGKPLPGIGLTGTGDRTDILIHPAHDANGWLSNVGCLNPAAALRDAEARVALADSRARVVAIIEGMKARLGDAFPRSGPIPGASVVVEGDPA